jgi:FtsP/CotA-like multicopper oxidase with cupredoxin domain
VKRSDNSYVSDIQLTLKAAKATVHAEIANARGPSSDVIPNTSFPMKPVDWENDKHVCVTLGTTEIWEIDNKAKELHNFHLHQTKFRLARPEELERLGLPGTPVTDPTKVLMNLGADMASESLHGATVWHDTLPVPLADNNGHVGKIFVVINFKATEQLGRYVFRCHILEHEDKGMMDAIEVMQAVKQ